MQILLWDHLSVSNLSVYIAVIYLPIIYLATICDLSVCLSTYISIYHASIIYGGSAHFYNYVTNIFKLFYIHSKYYWNYSGNYLI